MGLAMRLAWILLLGHLAALAFGLAGLLVALPHPEWWAGDPTAVPPAPGRFLRPEI